MPLEAHIANSRHINALTKIMNSYPPGAALISAIITYIHGVETRTEMRLRQELANAAAETACEGLHEGPAVGVKCARCYETELGLLQPEPETEEPISVEPLEE